MLLYKDISACTLYTYKYIYIYINWYVLDYTVIFVGDSFHFNIFLSISKMKPKVQVGELV